MDLVENSPVNSTHPSAMELHVSLSTNPDLVTEAEKILPIDKETEELISERSEESLANSELWKLHDFLVDNFRDQLPQGMPIVEAAMNLLADFRAQESIFSNAILETKKIGEEILEGVKEVRDLLSVEEGKLSNFGMSPRKKE